MIPTREEIDVSNGTLCAMRDEIPAALKPSEDREAAIRAWEEDATLHRCGSRFDDDDPRATYLMARSEITAAVALMRSADGKALLRELRAKATTPAPEREAAIRMLERRALQYLDHSEKSRFSSDGEGYRDEITAAVAMVRSAGDPDAKLRELRAWIIDEKWCAPGIVRKIDEMLAQPAPVEQPAPPAAAVPDDTRELVAQLADVAAEFFVAPWCDRAKAIAAKLRGGA